TSRRPFGRCLYHASYRVISRQPEPIGLGSVDLPITCIPRRKSIMSFVTRTLATAAAGAVVLGLAGPAVAQQAAPTQSSPAQPPAAAAQGAPAAAANVSDTQLRTFISAATEVQAISQKWQEKAAGSNSAEEVEEVRRQATDEMVGAVEEKGMT